MEDQRARNDSRISVNKLTEYLVAGSTRRRSIVSEQKRPSEFMTIYYQPAQDIIVDFMVGNAGEGELLHAECSAPGGPDFPERLSRGRCRGTPGILMRIGIEGAGM